VEHPDPILRSLPDGAEVLVQGASRGIGLALVARLLAEPRVAGVTATCRTPDAAAELRKLAGQSNALRLLPLDLEEDDGPMRAAERVAAEVGRLDLLINAAGVLHDERGMQPERRVSAVNPEPMLRAYRINALGALLVARAFEPLLRTSQRAIFASISARVGSIADNRLGGWYAYRMSKAALNMAMRTLAIEWGRLRPPIVCCALHPGTVETDLSAPFVRRNRTGAPFAPELAARQLLAVIDGLDAGDSGGFFAWDGSPIAW
jgi:NAD(P)-dependent dehydrogenase (short-subunit alcohol dehydrogenase family)